MSFFPRGVWVQGNELTLDEPDERLERVLDEQYPRVPGRGRCWKIHKGWIRKTAGFLSAIKGGRTSDEIAAERLEVCLACPVLQVDEAGRKTCGACDCGKWSGAELDGGPLPKLKWAHYECPLGRF